jgi:hypothetical protein
MPSPPQPRTVAALQYPRKTRQRPPSEMEMWLETVSKNYVLSADDEYYYCLILLPLTPEWGEIGKIRLKVFDIEMERPACIFVYQGLRKVYNFVQEKGLLVDRLLPEILSAGKNQRLLNQDVRCCSCPSSVWMADDNRPEWAVTEREWRAMKGSTTDHPRDGAYEIEEARSLQSGMSARQWKAQQWMVISTRAD